MRIGEYRQPKSLRSLASDLSRMTEECRVIAGGTDLVIDMKNHPREIPLLLSLSRVREMRGITLVKSPEGRSSLLIGAMESHASVAANPLVKKHAGALAMSCSRVGSQQIRNRGTIGGSLGNGSVAGDILPVLWLLHAKLHIFGAGGVMREMAPEELTAGVNRTTLSPGEVILSVEIPVEEGRESCFVKLGGRQEVTIAEISLCLSWKRQGAMFDGVEGVLGAVDVRPVRLTEIGEIFNHTAAGEEECEKLYASLSGRIAEIRSRRKRPPKLRIREGEKEYKERAVRGVVYDAVQAMKGEADE